jgi:hypothetical protein
MLYSINGDCCIFHSRLGVVGNEEAQLRAFRQVRDAIRERLRLWLLNQRKLLRERGAGAGMA